MIESLLRHARKFGTDGVAEAAIDLGFGLPELTNLLVELDSLEQASTPRIRQRQKKVNVAALCEARAKKLLGIEDTEESE